MFWGVGVGDTAGNGKAVSRGVVRGSIVNLETAAGVDGVGVWNGDLCAASDTPLETVPWPGGALLLATESLDSH